MNLLIRNNHAVIIIGLGLVGSAIFEELRKRYNCTARKKLDWSSIDHCSDVINEIFNDDLPNEIDRLDIIWSAGKTGFLATENDIAVDLDLFEKFNALLRDSASQHPKTLKVRYILISSAGGLFEGQTNVGGDSNPNPRRPYGKLKLQQEAYVKIAKWIDTPVCLRLSSVYTVSNLSSRMGLIPTIVSRAIRQNFVTIFGTEMTLRDYVLDEDIGRYVSENIDKPMPEEAFIIDGKPYSILEIKGIIEHIIGKKVYLQYSLQTTNASNISFSPNINARGLNPSNLRTNLRVLYKNLLTGHQA